MLMTVVCALVVVALCVEVCVLLTHTDGDAG